MTSRSHSGSLDNLSKTELEDLIRCAQQALDKKDEVVVAKHEAHLKELLSTDGIEVFSVETSNIKTRADYERERGEYLQQRITIVFRCHKDNDIGVKVELMYDQGLRFTDITLMLSNGGLTLNASEDWLFENTDISERVAVFHKWAPTTMKCLGLIKKHKDELGF